MLIVGALKNSITRQQTKYKKIIKNCLACSFYNQVLLPTKTYPKHRF